jgi:L-threonylcarbamoyladenylate synthase
VRHNTDSLDGDSVGDFDIDSRVFLAARALRAGEVVAIPTDTVYGLAAAISRPAAIDRLYSIKSRPTEKAIPILLSGRRELHQVSTGVSDTAAHLALCFWPGALTLIVPAQPYLPVRVTSNSSDGTRTVAVRVPNSRLARAIIAAVGGALAVTSANRSGEEPALAAEDLAGLGGAHPILVVDGGRAPGGVPSSVVLTTGSTPVVLREGGISSAEISARLAKFHVESSTQYYQSVTDPCPHQRPSESTR